MTSARPTIRDVARLAGVSHQTVSRVINGSADVTPDTRERVEAAILELGYRPSAIARSMARGRTHTLACIAPNLTDFTFASIIEGAEIEARQAGYFLLSSSARDVESFRELIEDLVAHGRVDGIMVINPYADTRSEYIPENFPVVFVGAGTRGQAVDTVCLDDELVGYDATKHLLSLGHRRIGLVTGPMAEDCSRDRHTGYLRALAEEHLEPDTTLAYEGDWSATSGHDALMSFARDGMLPDAIFAQNDRMAMGLLRAARDLGLRIPEQIAIIGIDDMPLAAHFDPPLTTMRQDMPHIGSEAARLLMETIEQTRTEHKHIRLSAELVVRQSTFKAQKEVM